MSAAMFGGQLHGEQVAGERRGRLAIAHHEANRALCDRLDELDRPRARRHAEKAQELARHDRRPLARAHVRDEIEDRIGLDRRDRRRSDRAKNAVDDPPVLHIGRQQAQRRTRRFAPSDLRLAGERAGLRG